MSVSPCVSSLSLSSSSISPSREGKRNGTRVNAAAELACTNEHACIHMNRGTSAGIPQVPKFRSFILGSRPVCWPFTRNTLYITVASYVHTSVHDVCCAYVCIHIPRFGQAPDGDGMPSCLRWWIFLEETPCEPMECKLSLVPFLGSAYPTRLIKRARWASDNYMNEMRHINVSRSHKRGVCTCECWRNDSLACIRR